MPNWCDNAVEITGDEDTLTKLMEHIEGSSEDLYQSILDFITPLEEQVSNKLLQEEQGWYDFNINNFGCKWDTGDASVDHYGDQIMMFFQSPWGPPNIIFERLGEAHPEIRVKHFYFEEGMEFAGVIDSHDEDDYSTDSVSTADDIPEELDDMFNISETIAEYEDECA